jgi:hypothetical protein
MHTMPRLFAGVLLTAGLALAGSAQAQNAKSFHADLSNAQEVPPTKGHGAGKADFSLNPSTKELTWTITYSGLSSAPTAAHIHGPAAQGTNAGVLVNLAPHGVKEPLKGSAKLTDAQIADLTSGKTYVNVHTGQNKAGEIRGQIMPGM